MVGVQHYCRRVRQTQSFDLVIKQAELPIHPSHCCPIRSSRQPGCMLRQRDEWRRMGAFICCRVAIAATLHCEHTALQVEDLSRTHELRRRICGLVALLTQSLELRSLQMIRGGVYYVSAISGTSAFGIGCAGKSTDSRGCLSRSS